MDEQEMTFDGHTGTLDSSSAEFQSLNYDLEQFHAMLDQDPSLTQGLDTLGNCNSDTSCVDQRCLSHLPNSDLGYGSPFQPSFENGNPMSALQTPNLHAANFDGINLHNMNFQQSNSLGQGLRNANTLQQNHHQPQFWMHTDNISHSMTNRFPGYSMFFPEDGCANSCFTPTPFGTHQNNSHHLQSTYGDCFSADCNSQCNIPCESQCGEDVTVCCYEADCHETAQSICCFGDFCDGSQICVDEPCNDEACKAASNPCTDANCMGSGTVSTTPVSPSIRTPPSLEADHMIQTITSPSDLTANTDALFKIPSTLLYKHRSESIATEHQSIQASLKSRSTSVASTPMEGILGPGREKQVIGYDNQFMCRWTLANGDVCGQILDSNENLQTHCKNEHLGDLAKTETGYSCGWHGCRRVTNFTQKSKLERHMQTHTGFKPVKCHICGMSLSAKQSLDQHLRIHSGEKPWKCTFEGCGQAFKQQSALTMHERTHTGEKPLQCDICGKKFGESSNLSKHRRIHNQKGNFFCKICGKDFHRQDQLRRHMNTNHRAKATPTPASRATPSVDSLSIEMSGIKAETPGVTLG